MKVKNLCNASSIFPWRSFEDFPIVSCLCLISIKHSALVCSHVIILFIPKTYKNHIIFRKVSFLATLSDSSALI